MVSSDCWKVADFKVESVKKGKNVLVLNIDSDKHRDWSDWKVTVARDKSAFVRKEMG